MRITLISAALLASGLTFAATPIDGWYGSAFGGYTYIPGNVENSFFGPLLNQSSFKNGYNVGGRVGFKSTPLRYEGEYTYLHASTSAYRLNLIPQTGVYGYSSANLIMANVYYDTPEILPAIVPYLGFGIGYANIQEVLNSTGPLGISQFNMSTNSFAYQGTAGLTYNFADYWALNAAYRYVATSSSNGFGTVFQAHIANMGVVYRFDSANYK